MNKVQKKLLTFFSLLKEGKISEIFRTAFGYFFKVDRFRFVELSLDEYTPSGYKARIPLEFKLAAPEEVGHLFSSWPDSKEEYERHYEVYYKWGFKNCFILSNKNTGEIVHFQFLLTSADIPNIRQYMPIKLYGRLVSPQEAYLEWTYTFKKHRLRGISMEALENLLNYCKSIGVKKAYSHMSEANINPFKLFQRAGFVHTKIITQVRFSWQDKHRGIFFQRKIK